MVTSRDVIITAKPGVAASVDVAGFMRVENILHKNDCSIHSIKNYSTDMYLMNLVLVD